MNVNELFSADFINQPQIGLDGIFKFTVPILEVGFMQFNIMCLFYWCKLCQDLKDEEDMLPYQGKWLAEHLSSSKSSLFFDFLLLAFPWIEILLLFTILLSGLNKVDFYHMIFLLFFVGYMVYPAKKATISEMVIVYSYLFIILKHIYTMISSDWINEN